MTPAAWTEVAAETEEAECLATLEELPPPTWQACGCVPTFYGEPGPEIPLARKELEP
ncbi:hypothetical protein ACFWNN_29355 [Lentzea sp. NPDC058450]|uniref:hypothetical protein n=1 Tax=Lentzea sp. NPDC058450 TaxID=3346505 RepID=UPI003658A909